MMGERPHWARSRAHARGELFNQLDTSDTKAG